MASVRLLLLLCVVGLSTASMFRPRLAKIASNEFDHIRRAANLAKNDYSLHRDCYISPVNCNAFLLKDEDSEAMQRFRQKMRSLMTRVSKNSRL
uniref:Uncharacterized protein n=1 Tax=Plectus sambesii TaxID=2011161 RepID=A0A914V0L0_9BILA